LAITVITRLYPVNVIWGRNESVIVINTKKGCSSDRYEDIYAYGTPVTFKKHVKGEISCETRHEHVVKDKDIVTFNAKGMRLLKILLILLDINVILFICNIVYPLKMKILTIVLLIIISVIYFYEILFNWVFVV